MCGRKTETECAITNKKKIVAGIEISKIVLVVSSKSV